MIIASPIIDIIWVTRVSGKVRAQWHVHLRGCTISGHYTYTTEASARRAARKMLARLFPDMTP